MKSILHLKGHITNIEEDFVFVTEDKTDEVYKFYQSDMLGEMNDKVDALIAPAFSEGSTSKVLSIKQTKKVKPLKMANYSTLISHMIKTKERLNATLLTLEEDNPDIPDINEKIAWLEKGIALFRNH